MSQAPAISEETLRECFDHFDEDGDGLVEVSVLQEMLNYFDFPLPPDLYESILRDYKIKDGEQFDFKIFSEFLQPVDRTSDAWILLNDSFAVFDIDQDGKISVDELRRALTDFGTPLTEDEFQRVLSVSKPDQNNLIDYRLLTDVIIRDELRAEADDEEEEEEEEEEEINEK